MEVRGQCPSCGLRVVSPQGQYGEKVCISCGLVLSKTPIAKEQSLTTWNPEWHSNWHENDSETLREWLTVLRTASCQLNLPSFPYREEAARRIRKDNRLLFKSQKFGKNKRAAIAALLHLVLRQYNKNRSIQEICRQLCLDNKLVKKQTWALNKIFIENCNPVTNIPKKTPVNYLFECGGKITTDTMLLLEAKETLLKLRRSGGNPIAIASGALYIVCKKRKNKVSKEEIAKAFGISHRTVCTNETKIRALMQSLSSEKTLPASDPRLLPIMSKRK